MAHRRQQCRVTGARAVQPRPAAVARRQRSRRDMSTAMQGSSALEEIRVRHKLRRRDGRAHERGERSLDKPATCRWTPHARRPWRDNLRRLPPACRRHASFSQISVASHLDNPEPPHYRRWCYGHA